MKGYIIEDVSIQRGIMAYQYKQMSVGLYPQDYEKLKILANRMGQSKGACIRELLHFYLLNLNQSEEYHDNQTV